MSSSPPSAVYESLKSKVVVVTGGASGIGAAIVEAFVRQGSRVFFLDVDDESAAALIQNLSIPDLITPTYLRFDLTDIPQLQQAVESILQSASAIDVLVNNAGNDKRHSLEDVTPEFWRWCLDVNLKHQFFMAQAVLPGMQKAKRGSIINLSSISWVIPSTDVPVYVMAKAAIVGMTRTLAHTVGADGVRVNCVMPGAIFTEKQKRTVLTDAYRKEIRERQALAIEISPSDVADLVLFLASEQSRAITNQSFVIDGGWV